MKPFPTMLLLLICAININCGDTDFITRDVIRDTANCFETIDTTDEKYIITLDKNCIDLELSIPPSIENLSEIQPKIIERDWKLIATLERDIRQKHWHQFYIQEDTKPKILTAYTEGKDFLFTIERTDRGTGVKSFIPIQFYYHQPEKPSGRNILFYPSDGWFTHWGPKQTFGGFPIDRSGTGLIADFDPGFPGGAFQHPENREKRWVNGTLEFRTTLEKSRLLTPTYSPHIADDHVLKIYAR